MLKRTFAAALVFAAACSPAPQQSETKAPERPEPQEIACNTLAPDVGKQVAITEAPAAAASLDLRGGRIAPGVYDLSSAQRIGAATGWEGTRAVVIDVTEDAATGAVSLNWAGTTPTSLIDRWTATLSEAPQARLTYTCGRLGEVDAAFTAGERALQLRVDDGANGALQLSFLRR